MDGLMANGINCCDCKTELNAARMEMEMEMEVRGTFPSQGQATDPAFIWVYKVQGALLIITQHEIPDNPFPALQLTWKIST